jgi:signal transduction histidine kinase
MQHTPASKVISNQSQVLVFAPFGKDAALIDKILQGSGILSRIVLDSETIAEGIDTGAGAAIITEEALSEQGINVLAQSIAAQHAWSDFPILVLTGGGSSTPRTENAARGRAPLGNVTLLERPLRPATLISAVQSALRARQRQYEIRDHLRQREAAEDALRRAHDELESIVEQRTDALRRLSSRLLQVQDEERRRIARELHDSLGQYLTATKINLDLLAQSDHLSERLREAQQLLELAISDTRTLSHLLHPPLLDEAGLASAATWYVEGFGQRSGIEASLEIPPDLQRLPATVETALFRILQEGLTNVHRHSGSPAVEIRLSVQDSLVHLSIRDQGKGIPPSTLEPFRRSGTNVGVGLAGIRERIKELGGKLDIQSSSSGTLLTVVIPIAENKSSHDESFHAGAGLSALNLPV